MTDACSNCDFSNKILQKKISCWQRLFIFDGGWKNLIVNILLPFFVDISNVWNEPSLSLSPARKKSPSTKNDPAELAKGEKSDAAAKLSSFSTTAKSDQPAFPFPFLTRATASCGTQPQISLNNEFTGCRASPVCSRIRTYKYTEREM